MAVIPIYLDDKRRLRGAATWQVWLKDPTAVWDPDCWVTWLGLEPQRLNLGTNTQIDSVVFRQRYGLIKESYVAGIAEKYRLYRSFEPASELLWKYVKVQITPNILTVANAGERTALQSILLDGAIVFQVDNQTVYRWDQPHSTWYVHNTPRSLTWYGLITNVRREALGGEVLGEAGDLYIEALGLEVLLTRKQIRQSRIVDTVGGGLITSTIAIDRGVPFNAQRGHRQMGEYQFENKSQYENVSGIGAFAKQLDSAVLWTAKDIIQYLLYYFQPNDANGPPWSISTGAGDWLDGHIPVNLEVEGRTLWSIFNDLISKTSGMIWWLDVDDSGVEIQIASMEPYGTVLPGGAEVPANTNRRTINIMSVADMGSFSETSDVLRQYSQVIVEGGFQGAVFTVSVMDGTLEPDWTMADENAYNAGISSSPTYDQLDITEQMTRNDSVRMSDKLRHVLCRYRVPLDWDMKAGNGTGGPQNYVFPALGATGGWAASTPPHDVWQAGLRFEDYLPLKEQWNFQVDTYNPSDETQDGSLAEFRRPFAGIKIKNKQGQSFWVYADAASSVTAEDEMRPEAAKGVGCSLSMHPQQLGLTIRPHGLPHVLAWPVEFDGYANPVSHLEQGIVDYQTDVIFTVYARCDHRVQAAYPAVPDSVAHIDNILVLRVGDRMRLDLVIPNTITEISGGSILRTTVPMFARDDRPEMLDLAARAYVWYSTPRKAIQMGVHHVTNQFRLGDMVSMVIYGNVYLMTADAGVLLFNGVPARRSGQMNRIINSVITSVDIDVIGQVTTMATDHSQVDFETVSV